MFISIDRREIVFWTALSHDFKVESSSRRSSCTGTYTGKDYLVDVANLDQSRLFGDEEDITFKEEEIALNGFEIGFETWVAVSARKFSGLHLLTKSEVGQTFGSFLNQ